jgi:hypothetical protein
MDVVLASKSTQELLQNNFVTISGGDRPFFLLLIFSLTKISSMPVETVLQLIPVLFSPALTLATYYFIKTGTKNGALASIVAIVVPFSTTVITGIYAGFYANWLALIITFIALTFLLKYLDRKIKKYLIFFFICITSVLFTHNYTWSYVISAIIIFLITSSVIYRKNKTLLLNLVLIGIVIFISIGADLSKLILLKNDSGLDKELTTATDQISSHDFANRWNNLRYVFTIFLGGFYTNLLIYLLALIWALFVDYKDNMNRLVLSLMFVGTIGIVAGVYSVQGRILWNIPLYIPVGILLYSFLVNTKNAFLGKILFISIMLHFGNYALRSLANL